MGQLQGKATAGAIPTHLGGFRDWQNWTQYAAVGWSLIYAALGFYWMVSGQGFPYAAQTDTNPLAPLMGRFIPGLAWMVVILAGIPAAAMGIAMLRGVRGRLLRPIFITGGGLLAATLLLLMTGLDLLVMFGYIPYTIVGLFTGAKSGQIYMQGLTQWATIHQLLCLTGGFMWLAATCSYARRSGDACPYCGRRDGPQGWKSPESARRWGRIAVYVSMVAPILYAITRFAWALGIPLGMSEAYWRSGQERGTWISGLFLAAFGLAGALLTLGLVQRWGEVFPRWMIGLAGRRVPIALAVIPAALISVLLIVGGIVIWSGYAQLAEAAAATEQEISIVVGPTLLFPLWGIALAVATLGYYYRRRGPCSVCGRGASSEADEELSQDMFADSIVPNPIYNETRTITIHASVEQIWPWLAQMGSGRAGWYAYDHIDNAGYPSATSILPEYQHIAPGDILPALPGMKDIFQIFAVDPPCHLILIVPDKTYGPRVSWEFYLKSIDAEHTHLIVRGRVAPHWLSAVSQASPTSRKSKPFIENIYTMLAHLPRPIMLGVASFGHGLMQIRQLHGIKRRAEAGVSH